jgi:hypothetical protein
VKDSIRNPLPQRERFNPHDCRDDMNLAEFPLAVLGDSVPAGQKTIEFSDEYEDWKTGQIVDRRVCITSSDKFGLPTSKDEDILLALLQITRLKNDFTDPVVPFTKLEVLEILAWKKTGWAYRRVEDSLHRWKGVSVHYFNAWRDNGEKVFRNSEANGIIEHFRFVGTQPRSTRDHVDDPGELSRFIWNRSFFESFRSGYLKKLDFDVYRRLKRPAARRAYRFLDKRFWYRSDWRFPLKTFACEKIGLSRTYDTGQLKARLQPALNELQAIGVLESATFTKQRRGEWSVEVREKKVGQQALPPAPHSPESVSELTRRGVSERMAKSLFRRFCAERIHRNVALHDRWLKARDARLSRNPPGFLVTAIRDDIASPDIPPLTPVLPKKMRLTPPPTHSDAKDPLEVARRSRIDAYWQSLTDQEREATELAALQMAKPIVLAGYHRAKAEGDGQRFQVYQQTILDNYIEEYLRTIDRQPPADSLSKVKP